MTKPAKGLISRRSALPLWHQLREILEERIRSGDWPPGAHLPAELELQQSYGLSRTTVRQALRELEIEGLVTRYRGRGTFVARPKLTHGPEARTSLSRSLLEQGLQPSWQLLSHGLSEAPEDVALRLSLARGVRAYSVRRLRCANETPIGHHTAFVAPQFATRIQEAALTSGGSLDYLSNESVVHSAHAGRLIDAIPAGELDVLLLGCEPGAPLLRIRRLLVATDGTPIEDLTAVYRGDRFQYRLGTVIK
jgi:GntR family transcriptional regulator